jgi:hypothetical protein
MLLNQQGALTAYTNSIARVRLVADAAAGGFVSGTVNGVPLAADLQSPSIGKYQAVQSGPLTLALSIGGVPITTTPLTVGAGADYTLLVAGTSAAATVALLPDNNMPSTSTVNPVKMRLVNGLNNLAAPASLTAGGSLVASNIGFGAASAYTTLAADSTGTADIVISAATIQPFTILDQTLLSGGVYTVFLLGDTTVQNGTTARCGWIARPSRLPAGLGRVALTTGGPCPMRTSSSNQPTRTASPRCASPTRAS